MKKQMVNKKKVRRAARTFRLGGGVLVTSESANFGGSLGACSPEKILENLECTRLHFPRFHSAENEEENIELLKEEVNHHRLIF